MKLKKMPVREFAEVMKREWTSVKQEVYYVWTRQLVTNFPDYEEHGVSVDQRVLSR